MLTLGTYFLSASRRRLCARLRTRLLPHSLVRSYTKGKFRKISVDCHFANEKPNKRGDNRRKQFILQDCVVVFSCRIVNANDEMVRGRLLESRNALKYAKPEGNGFSLSLLLLVTIKKNKNKGVAPCTTLCLSVIMVTCTPCGGGDQHNAMLLMKKKR